MHSPHVTSGADIKRAFETSRSACNLRAISGRFLAHYTLRFLRFRIYSSNTRIIMRMCYVPKINLKNKKCGQMRPGMHVSRSRAAFVVKVSTTLVTFFTYHANLIICRKFDDHFMLISEIQRAARGCRNFIIRKCNLTKSRKERIRNTKA